MSKQEFIRELENELKDMPEKEKSEAVQYYEEYFDEAGEENEEAVIQELGSPKRIAAMIRQDFVSSEEKQETYTEGESQDAYRDSAMEDEREESIDAIEGMAETQKNAGGSSGSWNDDTRQEYVRGTFTDYQSYNNNNNKSSFGEKVKNYFSGENKWIKIVVAIILLIVLLNVVPDIIAVIFGLIISVIGLLTWPVLVGGILVIGMLIAMVAVLVATPAIGGFAVMGIEGILLILFSIGILLLIIGVALIKYVAPFLWDICIKTVNWCGNMLKNIGA